MYREVCVSGDSEANEEEKGVYAVGDETLRWSSGVEDDGDVISSLSPEWQVVLVKVACEFVSECASVECDTFVAHGALADRERKLQLGFQVVGVVSDAADRVHEMAENLLTASGLWMASGSGYFEPGLRGTS